MIETKVIGVEAALDIRQRVLWPDQSRDFCRVPGDAEASHLGGFVGGQLISVLSLFDLGDSLQLRKFATLPDWQGKGAGSALFRQALALAAERGKPLWFDAREAALPFYHRFGFEVEGERFFKSGIAYRRMVMTGLDKRQQAGR